MDKESNSLGYLYEVIGEVFGDELDTIKQALEDKDKHIKELENKLNAIEEVCNKDNVKSTDKLWEIENILRSVEDEV